CALPISRKLDSVKRRLERVHEAVGARVTIDWEAALLALTGGEQTPEQLASTLEAWSSQTARAMLEGAESTDWAWSTDAPAAELAWHLTQVVGGFHERVVLRRWLAGEVRAPRVEASVARLFLARFKRKVRVLEDSSSKGDQVIDFIARQLAPGLEHELLGCQNIKGTGLDF